MRGFEIRKELIKKYLHEAELLIILFNMNPVVQVKVLRKAGVKDDKVNKFLEVSTLFNKKKDLLIRKRKPLSRREVILIEDEVMKKLYEPRLIKTNLTLKATEELLNKKYKNSLIINHEQIDKLELMMDLNDRSVDFLVLTGRKVISYKYEGIN